MQEHKDENYNSDNRAETNPTSVDRLPQSSGSRSEDSQQTQEDKNLGCDDTTAQTNVHYKGTPEKSARGENRNRFPQQQGPKK